MDEYSHSKRQCAPRSHSNNSVEVNTMKIPRHIIISFNRLADIQSQRTNHERARERERAAERQRSSISNCLDGKWRGSWTSRHMNNRVKSRSEVGWSREPTIRSADEWHYRIASWSMMEKEINGMKKTKVWMKISRWKSKNYSSDEITCPERGKTGTRGRCEWRTFIWRQTENLFSGSSYDQVAQEKGIRRWTTEVLMTSDKDGTTITEAVCEQMNCSNITIRMIKTARLSNGR